MAIAAVTLSTLCGLAALTVTAAQANEYNGLLASSTGSGVGDPSGNEPAGTVFWAASWSAPSGVQYNGFAYTSAAFSSQIGSSQTGGTSAGFLGTGGNAPTTLMFPWTSDCSISNSGHDFANGSGAASNGHGCSTSGSSGGWNFNNSEIESSSPGTNPEASYQTLTLEAFCQSTNCTGANVYDMSVNNLSGNFSDSYNSPSGSASWSGYTGGWVQTNSGTVVLNDNAWDPAGVCALGGYLTGPETVYSGAEGNQNPGVVYVGGAIGTEFEYGLSPCWTGSTDYGSWTLPGGLADGTYNANVYAADPGNYEGQGFSANGSPTIASYGNSISVDDSTPVLSVSPTGSGNTGTVSVAVGPSGVGSVSCSQGGNAVTLTPEGGNAGGGAGTYNYDFSTNTSGVGCQASNGDINGALVGTVNTPTIQIDPAGYTQGTWTSQPITIAPNVNAYGSDGTTGLTCTVNGNAVGTPSSFVISADGVSNIECTVEDGTYGNVASATFAVDEDSQVPLDSFDTGGAYAATSTYASDPSSAPGQNWINGTNPNPITIGVTATESAVLSGISQTTCIVNGYTSGEVTLTNTGATPFDQSFSLTPEVGGINGQNAIVCSSLSGADVTGADGSTVGGTKTEYVDVNDATWPPTPGGSVNIPVANCGITGVIDNGNCAYSEGPSQTSWYRSAQTIHIQADDTAGGAPITSITCSGVSMPVSSWTASADPQDVDVNSNGVTVGMSVVATVNPQGGTLSCSASDSAGPDPDTYALGTYVFALDSIAPTGYFEPQGYQAADKDVIQVNASDSGSGVAQVVVQAVDTATGQVYAGSALTGNPADGTIAYATYNPGSGLYDLTVNPALLPANDSFAFTATATDVAGNAATVTTIDPADGGGQFVITPGSGDLGDVTQITATADAPRPAPAAKTAKQHVVATTLPDLPSFVTGVSSNASIRAHIAGHALALVSQLAKVKAKVCTKARKVKVRVLEHGKSHHHKTVVKTVTKRVKVKCPTPSAATVNVTALTVPNGKPVTISGTLQDLTDASNTMAGDTVTVYQTDNATGVVTVLGQAPTSSTGTFTYTVTAGASREITLVYGGSANDRGTAAAFDARYVGKTIIAAKAKLVAPGRTLKLSGQIFGGDAPTQGAIVQIYYATGVSGHTGGWAPFKRAKANSKGVYVFKLPTPRTNAGYIYRFRVEIPTQTGWGYHGAASNTVTIRVRRHKITK